MSYRNGLLWKGGVFFLLLVGRFALAELNVSLNDIKVEETAPGAGVEMLPAHHSKKVRVSIDILYNREITSQDVKWRMIIKEIFERACGELGEGNDNCVPYDYLKCELFWEGVKLASAHQLPKENKGFINCSCVKGYEQYFLQQQIEIKDAEIVFDFYKGWPGNYQKASIETNESLCRDYAYCLPVDKRNISSVVKNSFLDRLSEGLLGSSKWKSDVPLKSLSEQTPLYCIFVPDENSEGWGVVLPRNGFMDQKGPFSYCNDGDRFLQIGHDLIVDMAFWRPETPKTVGEVYSKLIVEEGWFGFLENIPCFGSKGISLAESHKVGRNDKRYNYLLMGVMRCIEFHEITSNKYNLKISNQEKRGEGECLESVFAISYYDPDLDGCNDRVMFGPRPQITPNNKEQVIDLTNKQVKQLSVSRKADIPATKKFTLLGAVDVLFDGGELIVTAVGHILGSHCLTIPDFGTVRVTCRSNKLTIKIVTSMAVNLDNATLEGDLGTEIFPAEIQQEHFAIRYRPEDSEESLLAKTMEQSSSRQFLKSNNPMSQITVKVPVHSNVWYSP